jgi:probable F420-dependent oxidoreductase
VLLSGDNLALTDVIALAGAAEDAGAESVWAAEMWRDAFVPLTAIAATVKRARLGTAVAHFARTPLLTELTAMALAEYTGGRFLLGLGTAPQEWNERWHGVEYRRPVRRMREYVECLRTMWTSSPAQPVSYEGEMIRVTDYRRFLPAPYERVPIFLGAVRPGMIRLSGSHGDGLIVNVLSTPLYFTDVVQPNLRDGLASQGRAPRECEVCAVKICSVDRDRVRARALGRRALALYCTLPYFDLVLDPVGFTEPKEAIRAAMRRGDVQAAIDAVTEDMLDTLILAGTPDDVHRQLERFEGLFETLILYAPSFMMTPEETRGSHEAMIAAFAD